MLPTRERNRRFAPGRSKRSSRAASAVFDTWRNAAISPPASPRWRRLSVLFEKTRCAVVAHRTLSRILPCGARARIVVMRTWRRRSPRCQTPLRRHRAARSAALRYHRRSEQGRAVSTTEGAACCVLAVRAVVPFTPAARTAGTTAARRARRGGCRQRPVSVPSGALDYACSGDCRLSLRASTAQHHRLARE